MHAFLVLAIFVCSVVSTEPGTIDKLEQQFKELGNTVKKLEDTVVAQQYELNAHRLSLIEKDSEIASLRQLLEKTKQSVPERRFLVDDDDLVFFARLDATELTGVSQNETIMFDNVLLNAGNSFDIKTSQFTAPHDGYYFFSVSVASDLGHNHQLQVAIMKNGKEELARAHAHGDSGHLDQGSVTIVVTLATGDKVFIQSTYDEVTDFYGQGLTTFTGYEVMFK